MVPCYLLLSEVLHTVPRRYSQAEPNLIWNNLGNLGQVLTTEGPPTVDVCSLTSFGRAVDASRVVTWHILPRL